MLGLVDAVLQGQRVEDTLAEFKAQWPEPVRAARQLGGSANAARLQPVTWIIGVDEDSHSLSAFEQLEVADWWSQVVSRYDDRLAPDLIYNLRIPTGSGDVWGLYFDTSRAPYVVKNEKGGGIDREVPWREGNSTRSAKRTELMRILVPAATAPGVQPINLELSAHASPTDGSKGIELYLTGSVFFGAPPRSSLVVPERLTKAHVRFGDAGPSGVAPPTVELTNLDFIMPTHRTGTDLLNGRWVAETGHPLGVDVAQDALYIAGPGKASIRATGSLAPAYRSAIIEWQRAFLHVELVVKGADTTVTMELELSRSQEVDGSGWSQGRWEQR